MTDGANRFRELVLAACTSEWKESTPVILEDAGGALRWLCPPIRVNPDFADQDREFDVDFEVVSVPDPEEDYLVLTLYLVPGDEQVLPPEREKLGSLLVELDVLNREEPGVKFRFQEGTEPPKESWVVIENDVSMEMATPESMGKALSRLLDCAEAKYLEVEEIVKNRD